MWGPNSIAICATEWGEEAFPIPKILASLAPSASSHDWSWFGV
jgi:hypothetical protein